MDIVEDASVVIDGSFKMRIQLYNSSEIMKILRDINIEFELENRVYA